MDPEMKELLKKNLALSKENNELLLKMRKVQRWNQIGKNIYWAFVIFFALGAYYYIRPYIGKVDAMYQQLMTNLGDFKNLGTTFTNFDRLKLK
jgi:hypothetical protein